jgi:hypothetical protein
MCVSAGPVADPDVEPSSGRLKMISDPHWKNMAVDTLQHLFVASENVGLADPALKILFRRWFEARQERLPTLLKPPKPEPGLHDAEYFVWEARAEFVQPIGRIRLTSPGEAPAELGGKRAVDDLIGWLRAEEAKQIDQDAAQFDVRDLEDDDVIDEEKPPVWPGESDDIDDEPVWDNSDSSWGLLSEEPSVADRSAVATERRRAGVGAAHLRSFFLLPLEQYENIAFLLQCSPLTAVGLHCSLGASRRLTVSPGRIGLHDSKSHQKYMRKEHAKACNSPIKIFLHPPPPMARAVLHDIYK